MLTVDSVREIFDYGAESGALLWRKKVSDKVVVGARAGCIQGGKYLRVMVNKTRYNCMHIVWAYSYGVWPTTTIKPANGDYEDLRLINLVEQVRCPKSAPLTAERLRNVLDYIPETGGFEWAVSMGNGGGVAGRDAGSDHRHGYRMITIDGERYLAHRLAFFYMTGRMPTEHIDHINGQKDDNRWQNLREATRSQNGANRGANKRNTSGYKGVTWDKNRSKWSAAIMCQGQPYNLGGFDTPEEAHEAYKKAAGALFGDFARSA